ncbi:MAG: protein kinase [Vicinamibacterales bacterium]
MALPTGTRLGPYEVISAIGAGGMGEVYKARDTRLDRSVAIKILPSDVANDADRRARFEREARAVAMLDHPNVCGIFDIGEADGVHYLVMPYLEGQTLAARLENGPLPFDEAMRIAIALCHALHSAHKVGVTHRDLKPANIFLVRRGRSTEVKLLDFGLAKLRPSAGAISLSTMEQRATTQGTARGTLLGTFHYMSPEQLEGRDADARSDANGEPLLWLRTLADPRARPMRGTEGAADPFWSPDSTRVAFFSKGFLKWAGISEDVPAQTVSRAPVDSRGGAWGQDGAFVFYSGKTQTLSRVPERGGALTDVVFQGFSGTPRWPQLLPNGQLLFQTRHGAGLLRGIYAASMASRAGATRIIGSDWAAQYASGHLLFIDGATLMAQPFDLTTGTVHGTARRLANNVGGSTAGAVAFSASTTGVLAHAPGLSNRSELRWADRTGRIGPLVLPAGDYQDFTLSPDQSRLAYSLVDTQTQAPDVWILDLDRGASARITSERLLDSTPTWSPDGDRIVFRSNRTSSVGTSLLETATTPGAPVRLVLEQMPQVTNSFPAAWLKNGEILFSQTHIEAGYDIWSVQADNSETRAVLATTSNELHPAVSPDERWLAYASDQSGRYEVYVQERAGGGQRTLVSTGGGLQPRWRGDGRELFYLQPDGSLMAVGLDAGPRFAAAAPRLLFRTSRSSAFNPYRNDYFPATDGRRFLIRVPVAGPSPSITVVVNWPAWLKGEGPALLSR